MPMRFWFTVLGLLIACVSFFGMSLAGMPRAQCWTAAVTAVCAVWWMFEALPLAATSLVPLAVFPLAGVLTEKQAAAAYGDPIVLLFMGGFMLSKACERWGAHRRLASVMMAATGVASGRRVLLAFMLTTAVISMWISNTATVLMMLPVAIALLERDTSGKLAVPLLLGVAYSSSIGGIATPIGTPPNGVFLAVYRELAGQSVPFHSWMLATIPVSLVTLLAAWVVLCRRLGDVEGIDVESSGEWTSPQLRTLAVFGLAALGWITRDVPRGGWSGLLGLSGGDGDTAVAIAAVVILFLIPSGQSPGSRLLDWATAVSIPWGVLILFGGGIAIANAFESSGLSAALGERVQGLQELPTLPMIAVLCFIVTFLSEFTSNTATSNILMPVLGAAAKANGLDPLLLMFPATLSNSLAFMMPVGTAPNAIAFGTGHVRIADMVRAGLIINLLGVVIVTLVSWWLMPVVFGVSFTIGQN